MQINREYELLEILQYTVEEVGGGIGQDPATEVTHLGLNQPAVFSSNPTNIYSCVYT